MRSREQRRHTRFPVQGIYGTLRVPRDVRVLNLSRSGISFETSEALAAGESCFLELRHHAEAASIELSVRWTAPGRSGPAEGRPLFQVGARFVDVHRDRTDGLWAAIEPEPQAAAV
jgi:hypothetical protein